MFLKNKIFGNLFNVLLYVFFTNILIQFIGRKYIEYVDNKKILLLSTNLFTKCRLF